MNEEYKRVVDRINHSTNEKLRTLHDECVRDMINYMRSHSSASSHDIENQLNYITQKYNQGVRSAIQTAQDEYRNYISRYISQISGGLKRELNINYNTTGISLSKENLIKESTDEFKESLSKYVSGSIRKNNALSIQEEVNAFHGIGTEKNTSLQGIEKLCNLLTRASTTEGYMTISSLIGDIPEVMGYEIAVTPTDKHGHSRVVDICDHMKGEYPKEFKFRGWHPNCRCIISPIIPDDMMTPALKAAGFIGRPRGSKITPPREALEYVKENRDKNPQLFDKFDAYREVEFRGQKQFYMEMSPTSRLSFNIEEISNITGKYLDKLHRVDIKINDDMEEGVLMSTVPKDGSYQIEMRSSQAEILSQGLSKRGLKLPLTPQQVEVTADELHELTHTLSLDYTFGESLDINVNKPLAALLEKEKKLDPSKMSPEEYEKEKEKIRKKRAKIEQTRNTIIDFHHGFRPLEVETLETLVEWSMRENYASVMEQIGITLPADYASYINRGYNNSVTNFNALVNRIPVKNVEAFRNDIDKILSNPDKAFTFQRLADAIKRSGALNKGTRNKDLLMFMHTMPTEEFEVNLDYLAVPKDKSLPAPPTANAAVGSRASTTPPTTPIDIHNSGLTSKTIKNITHGTLAAGAISLTAGAAGSVIDPERDYSEKRYVPQWFYKNSYVNGVIAGIYDRAVNSVEDSWQMGKDLAIYAFYNTYMPFSSKTHEMRKAFFTTIGEIGEFMFMYQTNPAFKLLIDKILMDEIKNYLGSLWGTSPEHGYALGQLLFDVVSMFFGPGEIKAVLTGFKTTKTGIAFQRVIKTNLDTFFELIDKYFKPTNLSPDIHKSSIIDFESIDKAVKKTEQYIKVNAYKAGKKIDKLIGNNQHTTTNKINTPQVSSLITSNADEARQIVESIDNIVDNHVSYITNVFTDRRDNLLKFTGGHTLDAYKNFAKNNSISYTLSDLNIHSNGIITCKPILKKDGEIIEKLSKDRYTTLFPIDWNKNKIKSEILHALQNVQQNPFKANEFIGLSSDGQIKIQIIINNNMIKTAYPIVD